MFYKIILKSNLIKMTMLFLKVLNKLNNLKILMQFVLNRTLRKAFF
jgi:hypothetical protein